ncbi:hypothetical protein MATL_G00258200 [Megalops atlanticus]|uniref:Uncharacterized protein n=1 Tax=Megalops atlanticus TaxID=7932 RepID=A0A9D3PBY1_MEGAT|nr:hypothetical protein MATL_G00258200 [Megalops atlanticus]
MASDSTPARRGDDGGKKRCGRGRRNHSRASLGWRGVAPSLFSFAPCSQPPLPPCANNRPLHPGSGHPSEVTGGWNATVGRFAKTARTSTSDPSPAGVSGTPDPAAERDHRSQKQPEQNTTAERESEGQREPDGGGFCENRAKVEAIALDFLEMDGHGYDRFGDGDRDSYQIDYRRIVGDTEPARPRLSPREGEHHFHGSLVHGNPHGHGHETAAQRYSATRIQAGYEPER